MTDSKLRGARGQGARDERKKKQTAKIFIVEKKPQISCNISFYWKGFSISNFLESCCHWSHIGAAANQAATARRTKKIIYNDLICFLSNFSNTKLGKKRVQFRNIFEYYMEVKRSFSGMSQILGFRIWKSNSSSKSALSSLGKFYLL